MELNRFNSIAPFYDRLADVVFGGAIRKSQHCFIDHIPPRAKILIIGGGTGELLPPLFLHAGDAEVWYIEASSEMIRRAASRISGKHCVHFIHGTQNDIPDPVKFDVVITNFFLDVFSLPELHDVVAKIASHTSETGKWLVSDFVCVERWHKVALTTMYWFFALTTGLKTKALPPWFEIISVRGFSKTSDKDFFNGFIKSACFNKSATENRSTFE